MSNRRFIIFFLTGIVFMSAWLLLLQLRRNAVASETTRNTLCTYDAEFVDEIEVSRSGAGTVKLVRSENRKWMIVAPYAVPADEAVIARLLDMMTLSPLGDMRTEAELAELGEDFVDFGLSGKVRAGVTLRSKEKVTRVFFGATTASGRDVYARTEGLRNVFTLPTEALDAIPGDADGFRERSLISCAREQITGLDLRAPESPFVRLMKDSSGWRLSAPVATPADDDVVEALTEVLSTAGVAGFVMPSAARPPAPGDAEVLSQSALAPYGLTTGSGLSVTVKGRSGTSEQIVFGSAVGTNQVYALIRGGTAVVTIDAKVADLFRKGDASFRDTRVFPFGVDEKLQSVSISSQDFVYVLTAGANGAWRLEAPVVAATDPVTAGAWIDTILRLRRNDILENADGENALRVSVVTSAGNHPGVVVSGEAFKDCGSLANLRSKIMLEVDAKSVRRLSVKSSAGSTIAVVYDRERGVWNLDAGSAPATIRTSAVKTLLSALTRVMAADVETVAASPGDLIRCGLSDPMLVIAIDCDGGDAVRRNLVLGGVSPNGGRYATVGGGDAIFVLDRATAADLTVSLTE